jgi:DNA helicase-2/ATP-dependent DNA helicase PcrA
MTIIKLSPNQEKAVHHQDGALLVKASAGSGKTRVLTERIKLLVNQTKRKILAITFTNKAGEEMKDRLGNSEQIQSQVFIGTFHSFCQQVLEMRGNLIGLKEMPHIFENTTDRLQIIEEAIANTPTLYSRFIAYKEREQTKLKYDTLDYISKLKRELWSEEELLENTNEDTLLLYRNYQEILDSQNAIDFDDLIGLTYKLLINNPSIAALYRRTYEYICVDEAQDLNNAQYQLLKAITDDSHNNIMMVGDANQSIFAFNGSSPDYMTKKFVKDFNPKIIELNDNYRSARKIIEASEIIIPNSSKIINIAIDGTFELFHASNEEDEVAWIIDNINSLIDKKKDDDIEGEITYEKIAILARNKYVFNKLTDSFVAENIPYYFKITPSAIEFESFAMNVFDLAFRVKINPSDKLHLNKLLGLLEIKESSDLNSLIEKIQQQYLIKALEIVNNLNNDGSNLKTLLIQYKEFIKTTDEISEDDERSMIISDIDELLMHWQNYAKKTDEKSIHQFKNEMALEKTHPKTQQNGVTLSTVHTMKGQEYDIVFLMGMDDGTFPDYRAINKGGVDLIQEKNNAYVAFTRARRFLYVSYPQQRQMPWGDVKRREISRFLKPFTEL